MANLIVTMTRAAACGDRVQSVAGTSALATRPRTGCASGSFGSTAVEFRRRYHALCRAPARRVSYGYQLHRASRPNDRRDRRHGRGQDDACRSDRRPLSRRVGRGSRLRCSGQGLERTGAARKRSALCRSVRRCFAARSATICAGATKTPRTKNCSRRFETAQAARLCHGKARCARFCDRTGRRAIFRAARGRD